jgi:hypothetical protein
MLFKFDRRSDYLIVTLIISMAFSQRSLKFNKF